MPAAAFFLPTPQDTESDPPMQPVLDDLIPTGLVEYQFVTNKTQELRLEAPKPGRSYNWQRPVYSLCLKRYGPRHRWMGARCCAGAARAGGA